MEGRYRMTRVLVCLILFASLLLASKVKAQNFQRVSPQVTSTTLVIDQDSDKKKLKENLLKVLKNVGEEKYKAYYLIIESAVQVVKEHTANWKIVRKENDYFVTTLHPFMSFSSGQTVLECLPVDEIKINAQNEIILMLKILDYLRVEDIKLLDLIKAKVSLNNKFGQGAKTQAQALLIEWTNKTKSGILGLKKCIDIRLFGIERMSPLRRLLRKVTSLAEIGYAVQNKNSISIEEFSNDIIEVLPAMIGLNIEEQDRIKGTSEIIFTLQNYIENLKFTTDKNILYVKFNDDEILHKNIETEMKISDYDLLTELLVNIKAKLKSAITEHSGTDHPASVFFDVFYSKIELRLRGLKDDKASQQLSEFKISDCVLSMKKPMNQSQMDSSIEQFSRVNFKSIILDVLGNKISLDLKEGLKNPSRIAWINSFSTQQGGTELSTTIAYKIINRPLFIWEVSTNFFYNKLNLTKDDSLKLKNDLKDSSFSNQVFVGSNWRWITRNNKWEFGIVSAATGRSINNLNDLRNSKTLHSYLGVNVAKKFGKCIARPFYEWEFQQTQDGKDLHRHNVGLEFRLPNKFVIAGFFVNYKFNDRLPNVASIGIKFPVVK